MFGNLLEERRGSGEGNEYIWLGGRPVAFIRSVNVNTPSGITRTDTGTDCFVFDTEKRIGAADCGFYAVVTDQVVRPLAVLGPAGKLAWVADFDPFGRPNRVTNISGSAHPYANAPSGTTGISTVATFDQYLEPGMQLLVRPRLTYGDLEPGDDYANFDDAVGQLLHVPGEQAQVTGFSPDFMGPVTPPYTVSIEVDDKNAGNVAYNGISVDGFDYLRYEAGAHAVYIPLRSLGQYEDEETGLFENWNRFYDPESGRYLQTEPLLQKPDAVRLLGQEGVRMNSYSYAGSNPITRMDRDGRCFVSVPVFVVWLLELKNKSSPYYGKDKFAHCMANCQGTDNDAEIPCALLMDVSKEMWDIYYKRRPVQDSVEDMAANLRGLSCEDPSPDNCKDTCGKFLKNPKHFQ